MNASSAARQVQALEDGAVTDAEYAAARDDLLTCIEEAGLAIEGNRDRSVDVSDQRSLQAVITCWDRHASAVAAVHDLQEIAERMHDG